MSEKSVEESYELFRSELKDIAPLPWKIVGGFVCDANGHALLGCMLSDRVAGQIVLAAVLTGVATCGGYQVEFGES